MDIGAFFTLFLLPRDSDIAVSASTTRSTRISVCTALADIGDMSTSSDISYYSEHHFPGMHETNPAIDGLWGTRQPSQFQYALTFAGIFAGQSLIAWALPPYFREVALGSFIAIGVIDINHNMSLGLKFVW